MIFYAWCTLIVHYYVIDPIWTPLVGSRESKCTKKNCKIWFLFDSLQWNHIGWKRFSNFKLKIFQSFCIAVAEKTDNFSPISFLEFFEWEFWWHMLWCLKGGGRDSNPFAPCLVWIREVGFERKIIEKVFR